MNDEESDRTAITVTSCGYLRAKASDAILQLVLPSCEDPLRSTATLKIFSFLSV
jgi:hypothetical protein